MKKNKKITTIDISRQSHDKREWQWEWQW